MAREILEGEDMESKEMKKKEVLTGKNIVDALLEIIREVKEELVIVSPFIKLANLNYDLKKTIEELLEAKSKIIELHTRPEYHEKGEKRNTVEELSKIFKGIRPEHID
jgi:predicted transcriptional regulator